MRPAGTAAAAEAPWTPPFCTITAVHTDNVAYRACALCDRVLHDAAGPCSLCSHRTPSPPAKHLYRLLLSVATFDRVSTVIAFDRAARVLLGCPAEEFLQFCSDHPGAACKAGQMLEGEMCRMTLKAPKKSNAEHLRVVSVEPLCSEFRPVIHSLREIHGNGGDSVGFAHAR